MLNINQEIEQIWKVVLLKEFNKDYFIKLKQFLLDEKKHHSIYPKGKDKSQALNHMIGETIFFGDKCEGGGNDYSIAKKSDNIYS